MTTPDDDPTAPVDLPFPGTPASGTPVPPTAPGPPPPPASGAAGTSSLPSRAAPGPGAQPTPPASVQAPAAATPHPTPAPGSTPALVFGVLLVGVGALLLLTRLTDISLGGDAWPLWLVVPGVACLVASFALPRREGLGLAIAGAIVTTVGLILWAQELTDAYATWAYAWALVAPTAPGVGTFLFGAVQGRRRAGAERAALDRRRARSVRRLRAVLRGRDRAVGRADRGVR